MGKRPKKQDKQGMKLKLTESKSIGKGKKGGGKPAIDEDEDILEEFELSDDE